MSRVALPEKKCLKFYNLGIHFLSSNKEKSLLSSHDITVGCDSSLVITFDFCHAVKLYAEKISRLKLWYDCILFSAGLRISFSYVAFIMMTWIQWCSVETDTWPKLLNSVILLHMGASWAALWVMKQLSVCLTG